MNIPNTTPPISEMKQFPQLLADGAPIDTKSHIEPGTSLVTALTYVIGGLLLIIGIAASAGFLLLALIIGPVVEYFFRKRAMALLRGSSIEVGPEQFPELHNCAATYAGRMGLKASPAIYIFEGNTINAVAARVAGRKVIILQDDLVDACLRSGNAQTLAFVLGHEMAHHALGHTGLIRASLRLSLKKLSRLDEFSCDSVANALVHDSRVSATAITLLVTGPQLMPYLNLDALMKQAQEVSMEKAAKKAERKLTHPLLLRRLARFFH